MYLAGLFASLTVAANQYFINVYKKKENESFVEGEDIFPIYLYICYLGYFGMSACQYVKSPTLRLVHWVSRQDDILPAFIFTSEN